MHQEQRGEGAAWALQNRSQLHSLAAMPTLPPARPPAPHPQTHARGKKAEDFFIPNPAQHSLEHAEALVHGHMPQPHGLVHRSGQQELRGGGVGTRWHTPLDDRGCTCLPPRHAVAVLPARWPQSHFYHPLPHTQSTHIPTQPPSPPPKNSQ